MASSSFYKFNCFVEDIGKELHLLGTDSLKILLTNTAPNAADTHVDTTTTPCEVHPTSGAVELAAGNNYTKGGNTVATPTYAQTSGTAKLYGVKVTFSCTTAPWSTFRYAVLYNDAGGTTATRPVIGYWDYGVGGVTLGVGETFIVGNSNDGTDWTATYPILTVA